jgi:hypothetical protein
MKHFAVILALILVCSSALPRTARADETTFTLSDLTLQSDPDDPEAIFNDFNDFLLQNQLLRQLIVQNVMYQFDESSALKFSCNFAGRSGSLELVVAF